MQNSLHLGTQLVKQVMNRTDPDIIPKLRESPKDRILVVNGSYDHMEKILRKAMIPYTLLNNFPAKDELRQGGKYSRSKVLFVNCDAEYHCKDYNGFEEKGLTKENRKSLVDFVNTGGRIVTTDWAQAVVKYLFGKITAKEDVTEDECVKVNFTSDLAAKISGITYGNARPNWWLEGSSDMIHYRSDSGIVELVESYEMKRKYGSKHVAIGFKQGEGDVFHFVSHLIAQKLANYDKRDRECLGTFLDMTKTKLKDADKSRLTFGEIETTYTLMYTVLQLCGNKKILEGLT
jgi:hypothetical protein